MTVVLNPFTGKLELQQAGGGGGTVTSVSGTANRITSTGGTTPVIDIAATYVGQTSLTTLGTITTGVWNGTAIGPTFGGTGLTSYATGNIIYASASNTLAALAIGTTGQVLTVAGGVPSWAAAAVTGTPIREIVFDAAALQALETSFAPLTQVTGGTNSTNVLVRSFANTGTPYVNGKFQVPSDVAASGNVTFRFSVFAATASASKNIGVLFNFQNISSGATFDGTYTSEASGPVAISATQNFVTIGSFTVSLATLGWTASQLVEFQLGRDNTVTNNLASNMQLLQFSVEIPRTN